MPSIVKLTLESNQYERNIKNAQKQLNDFTRSIGINMKSLSGMAVAAGAVTGAMKVMKDAFFNSETALDEWGRTVESSKSLYSGFLSALNNSDISGFLGKMNDIVSAARDAYDAMDDLATYNAFTRGRTAGLRSNYSNALNEYKLNPTAENKQALKAANDALIAEMQIQAGKQRANYEKQLTSLGVDRLLSGEQLNEFINLFKSGDYDKIQTLKSAYKSGRGLNFGAQYWYGDRVYDGKIQDRFTGKWTVMDEDERKQFEFARVLSQVNDKQIDSIQALDEQYKMTLDAINNQNRQYNRLAGNNGKVGGATGGGSRGGKTATVGVTDNIEEKVRTQWDRENLRAIALSNTLKAPEETSSGSELWKMMTQGAEESTNQIESLTAAFERLNEVEGVTLKSTVKESKKIEKSFDYAAEAVGSIGSALSQIEDPAAKVVGTIAQAIASIALGYSQATVAASQTGNPYVWAAFAAAGLAQMVSMIATIHSATGYAMGGEIKGNSFSGDNIPIMANAGEVVLTRAMANTLASSITNSESLSNLNWTIRMKGEDIYLTADRSQIRRGRGRILTSKG